ncbi:MAG: sugar ABC transporter substrate-binding protein [Phycisphaerae bacterium]|nr:sugar ABC transporter substrate-binding protein [Phycisphaerae bacterium]
MRRIFLLILVILLAGSFVAWRLKPADRLDGRTRLVWVTDGSPARCDQVAIFNRLHPGVSLTTDPGNLYMEKIIVQSLAGVGPDVFDVAGRYVLYGFVEADIALDLTDIAAEEGFGPEATWVSVVDAMRINGRQYSFPAAVNADVIFYNKAIFDRYGVPYPPKEWTWEEFVDTGRRLTRRSSDGRGYECLGVMGIHWYELVLQAGGTMYSRDGTLCSLDSPEALEAIRFYYDLSHTHHILPTPDDEAMISGAGGERANFLSLFGTERLAMVRAGRWAMAAFRDYPELRGKIGVVHLPHRRRKVSVIWARTCAINRYSRHRDEAVKLLRFLASEPYSLAVLESGDSLPPRPEFAERPEFLVDPQRPEEGFNAVFAEAVARGQVPEVSPLVNPLSALEPVHEQIDLMHSGVKTPEEAFVAAAAQVNRMIYANLRDYEVYRRRYQQITGREFDPEDPQWRPYRRDEGR